MIDNSKFVDVESYITSLMGVANKDHQTVEEVDDIESEDTFEEYIDQSYQCSSLYNAQLEPGIRNYLSFFISTVNYIVPLDRVITVRQLNLDGNDKDYSYDVSHILNYAGRSSTINPKFSLFLKGDFEYAIQVDSIAGITSIDNTKLMFRKVVTERPWYVGISRDYQLLLLDCIALGDTLEKIICEANDGTKTAVV